MIVYLDSSTVLRVLLGTEGQLSGWGKWERAYSSELLHIEVRRAIDRIRLETRLDDLRVAALHREATKVEQGIGWIFLERPVLHRAAMPMGTAVRTLDALHLASALIHRERRHPSLVFATHDQRQATAAEALGFETIGA